MHRDNDTWGHLAGDHVLKAVAGSLKKGLRECDTVARYGGEEFAIILPETNLANALVVAERMRNAVQQLHANFDGTPIFVTMSFGVSLYSLQDSPTKNAFIKKSDQALYKAKQSGRNRCCAHAGDPFETDN